jgi:hypothetical protein
MVLVPQPLPANVRMASALHLELPSVISKESPLRDDDYRRLVASLPCCHCGLHLHSQAAHENAGKGRQMKVDDRRTFPLCTVGGNNCHEAFDQYRLVSGGRDAHAALGRAFTASTQQALRILATCDNAARRIVERVIGL